MAVAVAVCVTGCAGQPPQPERPPPQAIAVRTPVQEAAPALRDEPSGDTPTDFSLDVTVLVGRGMPESLRVEERNARYVVLPDGSLLADAAPGLNQASRPGRARWLYQQQIAELWGLCRQTGFANPSLANGPANPDMLTVARGERMTIIVLQAEGRRWAFVRRSLGAEPTDPAAARLVRSLAALAWIPDYTPRDVAPERYDYGPDPYAVYRRARTEDARP